MEQRSGRIIRRGNDYKEVDIFRYVTEGTFDSYSYQLVEMKQKFISQIMSGKSPARTCEDVDDTALSYAEIKALCAGDPKIKIKMDLDVAVARLNTLRQGYLNEHYQLEDVLLTGYPNQIAGLEGEIAAYQADAAIAAAHPPANGDDFTMVVDGQTFCKKELAGAALIALSKTVEYDKPIEAGHFRGFRLDMKMQRNLFGKGANTYVMELVGQRTRYEVELGGDPQGNIARLNNTLEDILDDLARSKERLASVRAQLEPAKAELLKPWPLEQEWRDKTAQLAKINAELNVDGHEPEAADTTPDERTTPRLPKPRDRGQER